jgi:putative ABC transport system permease protein
MIGKRTVLEGLQSLRTNRIRSSLSVLGIVFGVAAVVAMLSVVEGARKDVLRRLERLGTDVLFVLSEEPQTGAGGRLEKRELQMRDATQIAVASGIVDTVAPAYVVPKRESRSNSGFQTKVVGVTPSYQRVRQLSLQSGRFISELDIANKARVCVIGRGVAEGTDAVGVGSTIELEGEIYTIVGVLESENSSKDSSLGFLIRNHNTTALVPLSSIPNHSYLVNRFIAITEMSVRMESKKFTSYAEELIEIVLNNGNTTPPSFSVVIPNQLLRQEQHAQRIFAVVVGCVALIGVLIGGIGVMNIMLANVAERCKEIGIRRAIGATQKQVAQLFLVESVLLTCAGGLGGLVIGVLGSMAIARFGGWPVAISIWSLLIAMGMAGIVGVLAGWYPATRAAKLNPVDAMRHE